MKREIGEDNKKKRKVYVSEEGKGEKKNGAGGI